VDRKQENCHQKANRPQNIFCANQALRTVAFVLISLQDFSDFKEKSVYLKVFSDV
jgi:hypothetical protein